MSDLGSFWARRRAAVEAEETSAAEAAARRAADQEIRSLEEMDDAQALKHLGLPDPHTLVSGDDFSVFMRAGVPEKFRRIALRKLWRSNPVLACVDGLNDYDEDFKAQAAGQVVKTAYQVGKGMLAHLEHVHTPEEDAGAAVAEVSVADTSVALADTTERVDADAPVRAAPSDCEPEDSEVEMEAPAPRRMTFHFEETRT